MQVSTTPLPSVYHIEPRVFPDPRGFFLETWQAARYAQAQVPGPFVQDNCSRSSYRTWRGLRWDDPRLGIAWPLPAPLLSDKDCAYPTLETIAPEHLPRFGAEP